MTEQALLIPCQDDHMVGIVHPVSQKPPKLGLVILVGGPQYRVGAHRQFRHLACAVAEAGFPALRFDYRGRGDSTGRYQGLSTLGPDIAAAAGALMQAAPSLDGVVFWGLCEGASAALVHGQHIAALRGAILANPWLEDEQLAARAAIKHYYADRVFSRAFWGRLVSGKVDIGAALSGFFSTARQSRGKAGSEEHSASLSRRMAKAMAAMPVPHLCLLSEHDDTAHGFKLALAQDSLWRAAIKTVEFEREEIKGSDHVFASADAKRQVAAATIGFLNRIRA